MIYPAHLSVDDVSAWLPIDIRGEWSQVKADKVMEIVQPVCDNLGVTLQLLDVTDQNSPYKRFIFTVQFK